MSNDTQGELPEVLTPEFTQKYSKKIGRKLVEPVSIGGGYYLTEFFPEDVYPQDKERLLQIATTDGFAYAGLNNYHLHDESNDPPYIQVPVPENVRMYLEDEAIAAQIEDPRKTAYFAIRDANAGGQIVGAQEYIHQPEKEGRPEITERASFVAREYQNKHVASNALIVSMPLALKVLNITTDIMVTIAPDNIASQKVMGNAGFKRTGNSWPAGHIHPGVGGAATIYYLDPREEWTASQETILEGIDRLKERLEERGELFSARSSRLGGDTGAARSWSTRTGRYDDPKRAGEGPII